MKARSLIFFVAAGAISFAAGRASTYVSADGAWWNSEVPDTSRTAVVEGMISAYQIGWVAGAADGVGYLVGGMSQGATNANGVDPLS
jgi:hypothetical protein